MQVKVKARFVKHGPRKIRKMIGILQKLTVEKALAQLGASGICASQALIELIKNGLSAAKEKDLDLDKLIIVSLTCDGGPSIKRRRICSKGRATSVSKKMSHMTLILTDGQDDPKLTKQKKNTSNKVAKTSKRK